MSQVHVPNALTDGGPQSQLTEGGDTSTILLHRAQLDLYLDATYAVNAVCIGSVRHSV